MDIPEIQFRDTNLCEVEPFFYCRHDRITTKETVTIIFLTLKKLILMYLAVAFSGKKKPYCLSKM